ncbi:MAG: lysophospholipid acyltransferase family protein [Cyanobacteria bacterium P01_D01_bin.105]
MPLPLSFNSLFPSQSHSSSHAHGLSQLLTNAGSSPLEFSRWMLFSMGVNVRLYNEARLPKTPFLMISNHRSFLDAPLLVVATQRPVHFACHHYMAQVPVMKNVVTALGCFPLDDPQQRGRTFFKQATQFLRSQESIGLFPEGAGPMLDIPAPDQVGPFHRGFAHLALRAPVDALKIVPAAIVALEEKQQDTVPFKLLSWFDPTEPLFNQPGLHPAVIYRDVAVTIGEPIAIEDWARESYHGRQAAQTVADLCGQCHERIQAMLSAGCY